MEKTTESVELQSALGWALYRPDGTMMHVYGQGVMTPEREEHILGRAWEEIRPNEDYSAGIPSPTAYRTARALGYQVVCVAILPLSRDYQSA